MPANKEPSKQEFSAILGMLTEGQAELRADIKQLTQSSNSLNEKFAAYIEKNTHIESEVEEIKEVEKDHAARIDSLEKGKLQFLATISVSSFFITSIIGVGAWWYLNVFKPQQESALTNKSAVEAIKELEQTNRAILQILEPQDE